MKRIGIRNVENELIEDFPIYFDCDKLDESFMQGLYMAKTEIELEEVVNNWPYEIGYIRSKKLWRTHVPDPSKKDGRRQITARSEAALNDKMYLEWSKQRKTVNERFYQFLDERLESGQIKKNTWERMDVSFRKSCGSIANEPLASITEDDVTQLIEDMCSSDHSLSEYKNGRNCVKKFFLWAKRHKYSNVCVKDALEVAQISPSKQCRGSKKKEKGEVWLDPELEIVIPQLIADKSDLRASAFLLDFASGVRIGELSAIKGKDLGSKSIIIRRCEHKYKKSCGKGYDYVVEDYDVVGKNALKTEASYRTVAIPTHAHWILQYLKSITPDDEYVFRNKKGERYTSCALRSFWYDYLRNLGLGYKKPHAIRKTYCSILMDSRIADDNLVISQSGHTDISTTEGFYHKDRKDEDTKVAILDKINNFRLFGEVTQGHTN